jgi:predicted lipoprotein with Yx(FWY)xxD motif
MGGCGTAPVGRPAGPALSNTAGQPLYVYHDQPGSPASRACAAECSPAWTPLYAGDLDVPGRGFTILKRDDGSLQWAYRGEPVYYYSGYARELDRDLQWRAGLWVPVVAPQ